jgi:hypothetical protein
MEQVIVGMFTEVRRHKPSVIYIPNIDAWYATLTGTVALITFQTMLRSIQPTDPILLFATADCERSELSAELFRDFFGYSQKNRMEIIRPLAVSTFILDLHGCANSLFLGQSQRIFCVYSGLHQEEAGRLPRSREPQEEGPRGAASRTKTRK